MANIKKILVCANKLIFLKDIIAAGSLKVLIICYLLNSIVKRIKKYAKSIDFGCNIVTELHLVIEEMFIGTMYDGYEYISLFPFLSEGNLREYAQYKVNLHYC